MARFIDYTYYIIWRFYNKYEKGAGFTALLVLTFLFSINVMSIVFLYGIFRHTKMPLTNINIILLFILIFILGLCRYSTKKRNYKVFKQWWSNEKSTVKHPKTIWVQLYILFSVILFLTATIYGGIHHNEYN